MIFDLTQVEKILKAIDEPHREVQAIHIGGTNGKGSTAAMIASILQKEGYRVGLYTSPHLLRFTERIKVNGKEIERDEVVELAEWMREKIEAAGITLPFTFFDFTTSMAFLYFKQKMVDLAILEVGLGGRLDSTNVVDPLLSIITNIDKDHVEQLGRSLLKIAGEKAGIIKKGRPLITAATQPRVLRLFSRTCKEKGAPYFRVGRDFRSEWTDDGNFNYEGLHRKLWNVHLNLLGFHQITNGTTALGAMEVLEELGYTVSTDAMIEGLKEVNWPGRLEMVSSSPRVVLDGAHNPAGALVLRAALEKEFQYDRLILLVGMMKDKDAKTFLETLAPLADHILLSKPHTDRSASPSVLLDVLGRNGKKGEVIEEMKEAIEKGLSLTREEDLLCITGSLYTIGEAKSHFGPTRG
jgi:dihydrofolate synthase/folylpolyglutamate synthase